LYCFVRFSDLFALAEDHEPKPKKGKVTNKKSKKQIEESNSDTEASEVSLC